MGRPVYTVQTRFWKALAHVRFGKLVWIYTWQNAETVSQVANVQGVLGNRQALASLMAAFSNPHHPPAPSHETHARMPLLQAGHAPA